MRPRAPLLLLVGLAGSRLGSGGASAQGVAAPLSPAGLRDDLTRYFQGEKREGIAFMSVGAPALVASGALLAQDGELGRGLGYPLLAIGVIELVAGVVVYVRTDRQVARLANGLLNNPQATAAGELTRLRRVNREFVLLQWIESSLLLSGVVLAAAGAGSRHEPVLGAGLGLVLQSTAMLAFDGFASQRASAYTRSLERLQLVAGPPPALRQGAPVAGALVAVQGSY
jgi:hypothetical protein